MTESTFCSLFFFALFNATFCSVFMNGKVDRYIYFPYKKYNDNAYEKLIEDLSERFERFGRCVIFVCVY